MILERIHEYLQFKNLNFNRFEKSINVSHGSISTAWKHKRNIGSNVIEKILLAYPDLSAEWLLRGNGQMLLLTEYPGGKKGDKEWFAETDLISEVLAFFGLHDQESLGAMFDGRPFEKKRVGSNHQNPTPFERVVIDIVEKKYGQELKSMQHQLSSFFQDKLDRERMGTKNGSNQSEAV